MRILLIRTDHIGDVILSLPVAGALKVTITNSQLVFLGREYVRAVITHYPQIQQFIALEELEKLETQHAITYLKQLHLDAVIHITPNKLLAKLCKKAGISQRVGTNRRLPHWLYCNRLVNLSRSRSSQHEAQLNMKLLSGLGLRSDYSLQELTALTTIQKPKLTNRVAKLMDSKKFNLIIHPGSQGNTKEWPSEYFVKLIQWANKKNIHVLITGTNQEKQRFHQSIIEPCPQAINIMGQLTLNELIVLLAHIDGMVIGSTGPLHIAASLGTCCLGLFPAEPLKSVTRWGPLGSQAQSLSASGNIDGKQEMYLIKPKQVEQVVAHWQAKKIDDHRQ